LRTKTVKRHYCDFCNKGMFRAADMTQHEVGCTKNPNRKCWLCEDANTFSLKEIIEELKKRQPVFGDTIYAENLAWVREKTGDCPACILSVLRQADLVAFERFNYSEEKTAWYNERARETRDMLV